MILFGKDGQSTAVQTHSYLKIFRVFKICTKNTYRLNTQLHTSSAYVQSDYFVGFAFLLCETSITAGF